MNKVFVSFVLVMVLQVNIALASSKIDTSGDILQIAIPLAAFGTTFYKDDAMGKEEFVKSFLTTTTITHALKFSLQNTSLNERPNGKDYSFPSGHTASAFQGAFFLQKRYGSEYGVPAMALAGFTGYTRVRVDCHRWRDVIGATGIAFAVNYFLVSEYDHQKISVDVSKNSAMLNFKTSF
ncbi:MAG: phosphatase PAP2 family protein [Rickettsiales bacterium]|jgi:membrane-associated phospholipid phosphatase|nr:phosphatase PAP2 family protein [Rickettsiales bacterium]